FNQTLRDNLNGLILNDCREVDKRILSKRTWWRLGISVLAFHFLRHFPAWVGWLPAHTPLLSRVQPPVQPEIETQDRVDPENQEVKS
ncbi:MAG: cardiolipin synthase B, partial [Klebsiella michiganensis]|nr:cardiolipin synthase B [Klebsiella michiganensis]